MPILKYIYLARTKKGQYTRSRLVKQKIKSFIIHSEYFSVSDWLKSHG